VFCQYLGAWVVAGAGTGAVAGAAVMSVLVVVLLVVVLLVVSTVSYAGDDGDFAGVAGCKSC
jgi:hypothetical protein